MWGAYLLCRVIDQDFFYDTWFSFLALEQKCNCFLFFLHIFHLASTSQIREKLLLSMNIFYGEIV